ncbi:MAG TPA: preprotein translocase subunit SecE, partial [Candidatus Acidoferrales bacterium]|nr:preprotein translocase subunit SecE [Candidatus Acidoferrales bacterium]
ASAGEARMAEALKMDEKEIRGGNGGGAGSGLTTGLAKFGEYPRRLRTFLHDVRVEMKQVNWPSRQDVWSTTIVVTVTVAFFGIYFWITDGIFGRLYILVNNYFHHH